MNSSLSIYFHFLYFQDHKSIDCDHTYCTYIIKIVASSFQKTWNWKIRRRNTSTYKYMHMSSQQYTNIPRNGYVYMYTLQYYIHAAWMCIMKIFNLTRSRIMYVTHLRTRCYSWPQVHMYKDSSFYAASFMSYRENGRTGNGSGEHLIQRQRISKNKWQRHFVIYVCMQIITISSESSCITCE